MKKFIPYIIVFGLVGLVALLIAFAATNHVSIETENASLTRATTRSDSNASDGSYVEFAELVSGGPAIYVSTSGSDGNSGTSESSPFRTINKATSQASAGETIYVKAGNYGSENVSFVSSGTSSNPITLEGYTNTPGDRPSIPSFGDGSDMQPGLMPVLDGGSRSGTGISLSSRSNIVVRNFMITNFASGVNANGGDSLTYDTIYTKNLGSQSGYGGKGLRFGPGTNNSTIRNSVVVNAGGEQITIYGDNNRVENSKVYGSNNDGNQNDPDYYIHIQNGSNNTITGNYIERIGDLVHPGHGYTVKASGTGNLFENNVAEGMSGNAYEVRWRAVQNNTFRGNIAQDTKAPFYEGHGIGIREGASNNLFEDHTTRGMLAAVAWFDTNEDEKRQQWLGSNNTIRNSRFEDSGEAVFWLSRYGNITSEAYDNVFDNITIDGAPNLFWVESIGRNNTLSNSTIKNVSSYARYGSGRNSSHIGFSFENVTTLNSGFSLP